MVKRIILIASLLLVYAFASAQTLETVFNGYLLPITHAGKSGDTLTFRGKFINSLGQYDGTEIDTTSVVIVEDSGNCYYLPVVDIDTKGTVITASVLDNTSTLATIPDGQAAIGDLTEYKGLFPQVAGVTSTLASCIQNYNNAILDREEIPDTISQAHNFPKGTAIWDSSGTWVQTIDYARDIPVDAIVVDSISSTLFAVQYKGRFRMSNSYTVGKQLYVQPDGTYSTTDTSNHIAYGYALDDTYIQIGLQDNNSVTKDYVNERSYWYSQVTYLIDETVTYGGLIYANTAATNKGERPDTSSNWTKITTINPTSGSGNEFEIAFFDNTTTNLDTDTGLKYQDDTLKTQKFKINNVPIIDNSGVLDIGGGLRPSTLNNPHGGSNEIGANNDSTFASIILGLDKQQISKEYPIGKRIIRNSNGANYYIFNKDSIVFRTSGVEGIAALPANDSAVWAFKVDDLAVVDNGSYYAVMQPRGGRYFLSDFIDTSLTHSQSLQKAVDFAASMMRIFSTPSVDTTLKENPYIASNTIYIDGNYTFTDTLLLRHGVVLEGNYVGGTGRNYINQCAIDLNDNTKNWLNFEDHGGTYFQGGGVRNLSFYFLSEAAGFGFIENPGSFTFHNVRIRGRSQDGSTRYLEDYGIKVDGMIFNNWYDIFIDGVNGPGILVATETPVQTSTTTVWSSFRINNCEVGVKSDYNGIIDILRFNDFSFEFIDSSIAHLHANSHTIWDNVRIENVPYDGPANGGSAIPLFQVGIDSSGASTLEGTFILNNSRLNVISGNQDSTNTVAFEIGKMLRFSLDHVSLNNYYCPITSTNFYTHIALGQIDFTTSMKVDDLKFLDFEGSPPIKNRGLFTVESGTGKDGSVWDNAMSFHNKSWADTIIGIDEVNLAGGISKTTRNAVKLLNNGTDNGTIEVHRTGVANIQLNASSNSYIFGPVTNALRLGVGEQFPLKTLHVGGAQGDLQVDNGLFFPAFGNASTKSLSTLGLSKGTHPYPVFASDGTITNESSIPASDISELPDSLNTIHWTHNNTLSNGDTLTLLSHQTVIYLGSGDSVYIDESNLTRDAIIRVIQSSGISTIFKVDGLSNRFYELGTNRSYSKTIGTGSVKELFYNQATNHWHTTSYYQSDIPIEDVATTTDTIVVYRGMEIAMDGTSGSYTVQLDLSEVNDGESFNIKVDDIGASTVTVDVLNEASVVQYEGDSIATTYGFTGSYTYVHCSWRGGVLYITR